MSIDIFVIETMSCKLVYFDETGYGPLTNSLLKIKQRILYTMKYSKKK